MTSRKSAADDFGYKRGAGAYSKEVKLNRGPTSWDQPTLSDGDEGLAVADKAAKFTRNEDAGLREGKTDAENYPKVDIWDLAESQSDRTGPVRLRKRDQDQR